MGRYDLKIKIKTNQKWSEGITLENEVVVLRTRAWPASRQIYQQIYW